MLITRVELKNIKNHAEAEWTFLPGLIAICGPNGSGKTSILEAIAWALFDHLVHKREDFVRRGERKGQVTVSFVSDLDEREYTVSRDTGGNYFVVDPITKVRLAEQKNQVLPWLSEHLGTEPEADLSALFRTTIGVPQGTFTNDFVLTPAQRKSVFDRTLKVDEYRNASEQLRSTQRCLETQKSAADLAIASAEGELKVYSRIKEALEATLSRQSSLKHDYDVALSDQQNLESAVVGLDEVYKQIEALRGTVERLDVKLALTRDKLTSAGESAEQARAASTLVEAARAGYLGYLTATACLNKLEQQRLTQERLKGELAAIDRRDTEISARAEHNRKRLDEIETAREELSGLSSLLDEQSLLESRIAELRESRGTRHGLERSLRHIDEELGRLRLRYSELASLIEKADKHSLLAQTVPTLEAECARIEGDISRREIERQSNLIKHEHLERLRSEFARLKRERDRHLTELADLETLRPIGARTAAISASYRRQTDKLAQLRAEVERDSTMISGLESGGVCPLLTEKCLNLKPGETLDSRFREGLENRQKEIVRNEAELPRLEADLETAQVAAAKLTHAPQLRSEFERITNSMETLKAQILGLENELSGAGSDILTDVESIKERQAVLQAELKAARDARDAFMRVSHYRGEVESIKALGLVRREEREELAARLRDLSDLDARLSETSSSLQALANPRGRALVLEHQIARTDEWKNAIALADREAIEVLAEHRRLAGELEAYSTLDFQLVEGGLVRTTNERDYRVFIANEQSAATVPRRQQEEVEIAAEVNAVESVWQQKHAELSGLTEQYDPLRHALAKTSLEEKVRRATQIATQLEYTTEQVGRLEEQVTSLERTRAQFHLHVTERDRLSKLEETTEFIRNMLQQAAPFITEAYLFTISHEANQLYREITGRHDVTLQWTRDYEITLEEQGRERPFTNLSGGEQMAAALSIRLALLKELSDLKLAFFDEPTANLDEERRRNLAQQIGQIKHYKQLFVITHDDSFEGYTDQVIMLGRD